QQDFRLELRARRGVGRRHVAPQHVVGVQRHRRAQRGEARRGARRRRGARDGVASGHAVEAQLSGDGAAAARRRDPVPHRQQVVVHGQPDAHILLADADRVQREGLPPLETFAQSDERPAGDIEVAPDRDRRHAIRSTYTRWLLLPQVSSGSSETVLPSVGRQLTSFTYPPASSRTVTSTSVDPRLWVTAYGPTLPVPTLAA